MPRRIKTAQPEVAFTNVDKVFFPATGFTKGDLIRYYIEIAPAMVPHFRGRPVTLIRMPDGVQGERFYAKNAPAYTPKWVPTTDVSKTEGGFVHYIMIEDTRTLAWCANNGAVELHPFLHRANDITRPTHLAFDLDPGEGADLLTCIEVGWRVREVLQGLGLEAWPKVSGSKGLQLYVPLNTAVTYEAATPFAKAIAELLHQRHPDLIVSDMKKVLRKERVLIDWSQNHSKKTTVGPYSVRGKRDEPFVSMPVTWEELKRAEKAGKVDALFFPPAEALKRVAKQGDIFAPVLKMKQRLPKEFLQKAKDGALPEAAEGTGGAERKGKKRVSAAKKADASRAARSLKAYTKKRDFSKTAEPPPDTETLAGGDGTRRFVIQKHHATNLHYDFRLEMDGVLKSWAVPKGLATEVGVKRAAFQVEDHPLAYFDFEGTIPKGQYGGGTVMVWDVGTYELLGGDFEKGDLKLQLAGKKLKGEWHIFRIKSEEAKPVWLVAKSKVPAKSLTKKQETTSVLTGRTLEQIAAAGDAVWNSRQPDGGWAATRAGEGVDLESGGLGRGRRPAGHAHGRVTRTEPVRRGSGKRLPAPPAFVAPMIAREVAELPDDGEWLYEIKLDGYRALGVKHGAATRVVSRQKKSLAKDFPGVAAALATIRAETAVLDGEIVALDGDGRPSFQLLQNRRGKRGGTVVYYAFDLLHLDGEDWRPRPLEERKAKLADILKGSAVRLSASFDGPAAKILAGVEEMEMEGVVAKRRGSPYESGKRSGAWVKYKRAPRQEFVIGGYTRARGRPVESLVIGYYEAGKLLCAGKVRQGMMPRERRELAAELKPLQADVCPFSNLFPSKKTALPDGLTRTDLKHAQWVMPKLVAQVSFSAWTDTGHLDDANYEGLRRDKDAEGVGREG